MDYEELCGDLFNAAQYEDYIERMTAILRAHFPESAPAEQGEELAALLSTLDDAVGDLEADGNPEYAEAINQARHILTVLTQPREPRARLTPPVAPAPEEPAQEAKGDAAPAQAPAPEAQ